MTKPKAREWWIEKAPDAGEIDECCVHARPNETYGVHVIEYAAYVDLKQKHEELIAHLPKVPTGPYEKEMARDNNHLKGEIKRLQNSMDKLRMDLSDANSRSDVWRAKALECDKHPVVLKLKEELAQQKTDMTAAYLVGFEKGKSAAKAEIERLRYSRCTLCGPEIDSLAAKVAELEKERDELKWRLDGLNK